MGLNHGQKNYPKIADQSVIFVIGFTKKSKTYPRLKPFDIEVVS